MNHRIKLVLEGVALNQGHVRLDQFLFALEKLNSCLNRLDKQEGGGDAASDYVVVGLSLNSPATVEIEARNIRNRPDVRPLVFRRLNNMMSMLDQGQVPDADYEVLDSVRSLSKQVGHSFASAQLIVGDHDIQLSNEIAMMITHDLHETDECYGTTEGRLEAINIHAGADQFTIYPEVGAKKIICHFQRALMDEALSAIGRKVLVSGRMQYRKRDAFPHRIEVDEMQIYPDTEQLPDFYDLLGLTPTLGPFDSPAEEMIRELRHEWH